MGVDLRIDVEHSQPPPPPPMPPSDEAPGILALFNFFLATMNACVRGSDLDSNAVQSGEALGFNSSGPILSRRRSEEYTQLLHQHSMGYGSDRVEGTSAAEQLLVHTLWLNTAVPRSLQYAYNHMTHTITTTHIPDMIESDGHVRVVKIFLALLDMSFRETVSRAAFRRLLREMEEEVSVNHYEAVFRQRAEPLIWFNMSSQS